MKKGQATFITAKIGNRIWIDMVDLYNVMIADPENWYDRFTQAMEKEYSTPPEVQEMKGEGK